MMKQTFIKSAMLLLLILSMATTRAQEVALKTNLLGWASTSANAGIEIGTGKKTTFQLFGTLNPWKFSGDKKMRFWNVMPEYRWYTCQKFGGHFFGIHALGGEYNIKNIDMPFGILPKTLEGRHYEGWYVGGGLTYGYQWLLNKHLNFEGSIGLGYAYSPYKLYGRCEKCLDKDHRNYVSSLYTLNSKLFTYQATPEDWEGFKKKIQASNLADKEAILEIANSSLAPDDKDLKIRKLHPASYRYILDHIYPRLRHSDYTVTYTVRPFSIEEAKEILKTKPQQLSLQEMFLVAQTYEPGSPEFNEVFDIAVRLFPDNETANLNAACTDLQKGDLTSAEKHLAKAGNSKEAERVRDVFKQIKELE